MKTLLACLVSLLISACSATTGVTDWSQQRNMRQHLIELEDQLLYQQDGWQVWLLYKQRKFRCIALKPASGRPWPEFTDDFAALSGGAGFYMLWEEKQQQPYFGFYGAHPYGKIARAWRNGQFVPATNDRDVILGWEGETIDFEITTQPEANIYSEVLTLSGRLDFSGVQQAYEAFQACHQRF